MGDNASSYFKSVNELYFSEIDTFHKAYWLGFIVADGSLKTKNKVSLVSKDNEHIIKFSKAIESTYKITKYSHFDKRTSKIYTGSSVQITNSTFKECLLKHVGEDKSINYKFPKLKSEYYKDFIAGMIDGDGSITYSNKSGIRINLISTEECLEGIINYFKNIVGIDIGSNKLYKATLNQENVWKLYICKNCREVLAHVYGRDDKNLYLDRKQQKIGEILKKYENKENSKMKRSIRKTIKVYNNNNELVNFFKNIKECREYYKIKIDKWYSIMKNDGFYTDSIKFVESDYVSFYDRPNKKKIIHIDLDGVVCDFGKRFREISNVPLGEYVLRGETGTDLERRQAHVDYMVGEDSNFFQSLEEIVGAKEAIFELSDKFDIYFLSTPMDKVPHSFTGKKEWLNNHYGEDFVAKRLILTHRKDLVIGDFLVDDRVMNGAGNFTGELVLFGGERFKNWDIVKKYLIERA